jgi:superfamily II DNA/RNA helicase
LPILQRLLNGPRGKLRSLILSPTRELAEQTHTTINRLGRKTGLLGQGSSREVEGPPLSCRARQNL